jgi:hypothetical protein
MRLGSVPHRALHLLPLTRAQKERAGERDMQLAQVPYACAHTRSRLVTPNRVHIRPCYLPSRDVQGARDDTSECPPQRERDIDVRGPLPVDVWGGTRTSLVLRWVIERDGGGEVCWERWELALLGWLRCHCCCKRCRCCWYHRR